MSPKPEFTEELAKLFLTTLFPKVCEMSEGQLSTELNLKIREFCLTDHTVAEVYAFCDWVAAQGFHGQASSSVMTLCDVQRFYEKPEGVVLTIPACCAPSPGVD